MRLLIDKPDDAAGNALNASKVGQLGYNQQGRLSSARKNSTHASYHYNAHGQAGV